MKLESAKGNSVLLLAGGERSEMVDSDRFDASYVIAIDSGLIYCVENQIEPDIVMGDMDSVDESMLSSFSLSNPNIRTEVYPKEKDYTDLELSLKFVPSDARLLVIYGGLGGRLDHTLTNIDLISSFVSSHNMTATFRGANEDVYILNDHYNELTLQGAKGDTISLIPLTQDVFGVSIDSVKYPLNRKHLLKSETLGISNVMLDVKAQISIESGILLVIYNKRKNS